MYFNEGGISCKKAQPQVQTEQGSSHRQGSHEEEDWNGTRAGNHHEDETQAETQVHAELERPRQGKKCCTLESLEGIAEAGMSRLGRLVEKGKWGRERGDEGGEGV
eukprot:CAMPEP_0118658646 /NCGR_PEP_ID=MMETSP0785-20121206/14682_1 /TAXON_ID=91992 /ORGANISM="Bolidomonas pacifica, Strain CCMP 1866" /LENGTH=105 /DNA_ID=CAMNT_0006551683 /DNA_START=158 /DNA_END=472 /DNA_ORIENTATION=-